VCLCYITTSKQVEQNEHILRTCHPYTYLMQTKVAFRFVVAGRMLRVLDSMDGGRRIQAHEAMLGPDGQTIVSRDWTEGWGPLVVPRHCLSPQIFDDPNNPTQLRENPSENPPTKTSRSELRMAVNRAINLNTNSNAAFGNR